RAEGPGRETSFANGSVLTPSMPEPWNTPGCWRILLGSLGRSDSPLQLRLKALPALAGWGVEFLRNSRPVIFEQNTLKNLRLARFALAVTASLREQTGMQYGRSALGTLRLFRDPAVLQRAVEGARRLAPHGLDFQALSPERAVELEPALTAIGTELAGAIHY